MLQRERLQNPTNINHVRIKSDPLGRLTAMAHEKDGDLLDSFKYNHDPAGNITSIDKYRKGMEAASGLYSYGYDPLDRLVSATHGGSEKLYSYDSLGNRVSSMVDGTETTYDYNARNQLVSMAGPDVERRYSYDDRGNLRKLVEDGRVSAKYYFDATNRMTRAETSMGVASYTYNGMLGRVGKSERFHDTMLPNPEREVRHVLDLTRPYDNLLMTVGTGSQRFTWGNELISMEGDATAFYLHDHLGSPVRLVGDGIDEVMAFDEFGVPLAGMENLHQPFGFTGYQMDDVTGMWYTQARYYEPAGARFVAEDTHWHPGNMIWGEFNDRVLPDDDAIHQSGNLYSYVMGNPLSYMDRDGNKAYSTRYRNDQYTLYVASQGYEWQKTIAGVVPFFAITHQAAMRAGGFRSIEPNYNVITGTLVNILDIVLRSKLSYVYSASEVVGLLHANHINPSYMLEEAIYNHFTRNVWHSDSRDIVDAKFTNAVSWMSYHLDAGNLEVMTAYDYFGDNQPWHNGKIYMYDPLLGRNRFFNRDDYYFFMLDDSMLEYLMIVEAELKKMNVDFCELGGLQ